MSIGDTGCMLTTSLPVYHSFFGVGKMMNSRWWNCEGRKFLPKDIVHPSNELVKRLQRGESPFRLSENLACVTWKDKKFAICCQTKGIRNRSSKKESQIRRPVVNKKLCSAKSNQNMVFLAIESANKEEINILSARDTTRVMMQWHLRGSVARCVHLGLRINRPPLADDKVIFVWKLILFNCEVSWDGLPTALSLGHGSYPDSLSYFFPKGVFFWQVFLASVKP